jgi:hypothetical protein
VNANQVLPIRASAVRPGPCGCGEFGWLSITIDPDKRNSCMHQHCRPPSGSLLRSNSGRLKELTPIICVFVAVHHRAGLVVGSRPKEMQGRYLANPIDPASLATISLGRCDIPERSGLPLAWPERPSQQRRHRLPVCVVDDVARRHEPCERSNRICTCSGSIPNDNLRSSVTSTRWFTVAVMLSRLASTNSPFRSRTCQ